ncbi:hypothetical protein ONS95_000086 [Cadophora gregata]|uniref:uncharacterized protein n=1 Tax=Cadophora gregata TaxID=51156 RepID=UPI0026DAE313|nr:uncharacterized protein ONS95_000086 [Cadophora gregata]KAK0128101.1 hypothetical protein ONS95_000086 [Cadophora gregata]
MDCFGIVFAELQPLLVQMLKSTAFLVLQAPFTCLKVSNFFSKNSNDSYLNLIIFLQGLNNVMAPAVFPIAITSMSLSTEFLGNVTSTNTEDIRDLGFSGTVGSVNINTYGDTLICGDGSAHDRYYQTPPCLLLHANSAAYARSDPRYITDFNLDRNGNAQIFCGYFDDETPESSYGMGLTNVIALPGSSTKGILYFLKNFRPNGKDMIVGAGVAVVDVSGSYPTCRRTSK